MTIEQTFNNIARGIERCWENLLTCERNFRSMPNEKKYETIFKIGAIAFAAGLTAGLITGSAVVGVLIAGVTTVAAFAYLTSNEHYGVGSKIGSHCEAGVNSVKSTVSNFIDSNKGLRKFVDGANDFANDALNTIFK